jgi:hypothetical protein
MSRHTGILVFALLVVPAVIAQSIPKDLLLAPTRLELDKPTTEVKAGSSVTYTVTLKNVREQAVPAPHDLQLQIETPSGIKMVTVQAGQSSATFTWQAVSSGIARMTVRSGSLHPASGLVLVAPPPKSEMLMLPSLPQHAGVPAAAANVPQTNHHSGIGAIIGSHAVGAVVAGAGQPAQPAPAPAEPTPTSPQAVKLQLFINPVPVLGNAIDHVWKASVSVAAMGSHDEFMPVTGPVQVHFNANRGRITPPDITLAAGQLSNFDNPAILTADSSGNDTIEAISSLGTAGPLQVQYLQPPPTKLKVYLDAPQLLGNGSSNTKVEVCLIDGAGASAASSESIQVVLNPAGQMSKSVVPIAPNSPCSETVTWTAVKPGPAQITAEATGLGRGVENILFPKFPWYFVWLAAVGGVLGSFIANSKESFTRRWWSHTWRNLLVGAVLGAVCYVLVRYGALALKDFPVDIQKIPVVTGLGSFVIGFVIGLWGRKLLKVDENPPDPSPTRKAKGAGN